MKPLRLTIEVLIFVCSSLAFLYYYIVLDRRLRSESEWDQFHFVFCILIFPVLMGLEYIAIFIIQSPISWFEVILLNLVWFTGIQLMLFDLGKVQFWSKPILQKIVGIITLFTSTNCFVCIWISIYADQILFYGFNGLITLPLFIIQLILFVPLLEFTARALPRHNPTIKDREFHAIASCGFGFLLILTGAMFLVESDLSLPLYITVPSIILGINLMIGGIYLTVLIEQKKIN